MKRLSFPFLLIFVWQHLTGQEYYLFTGTYNSPKSEGIYVYKFNSNDGTVKEVSHVKTPNPSFLAVSPDQKFVYAVNENADSTGKGGGVTSFSFDKKSGVLSLLSRQSSGGNHPCYICIDKTGKWVFAGNYSSGNFSLLPVKNGLAGKATRTIQLKGSGPDTTRQKSSHVHGIFIKPDNTGFYVTDLGTDKIMKYDFNAKTGNISPQKFAYASTAPGSGPRHMAFHPKLPVMYLLNELNGTIDVLKNRGNGDLAFVQNMTAFPLYYRGPAGSADIHVSPDGKFLYSSNRGLLDNLAIFSIDPVTGFLKAMGHQSTLGEKPRNFNFDPTGKFLLVANQESNEIVIFKRDISTGLLTDTGKRISVGKPVCLKWVNVE